MSSCCCEECDLLLKGGHVIDPANNIDEPMDVAICGGKIATVAKDIPADCAKRVANLAGLYVTPGIVDIHVHCYKYSGSVFPDQLCLPNGVTTVVDAGGPGWKNFEEFKATVVDRAKTRVLAMLNIAGGGMVLEAEQNVADMDPVATARKVQEYPDLLVGVKTAHYQGAGFESVDNAVHAGRMCRKPVMMDVLPTPTRPFPDLLLKHMRPGDIHTHMYNATRAPIDEQGALRDYVVEARKRGVIFDVGHGGGSFVFRCAVPAIQQGFLPDSISTDLHQVSALIPNASMPQTMSKFLNMGLTLVEVIGLSTTKPAKLVGHPELGTLSVGACADVAVLRLLEGDFGFVDIERRRLSGKWRLQCALTVRAGQIVWDLDGLSWPDWREAR